MPNNTTIPLTQIEALRLTCKHCNAALILPLTVREVPRQCFNCEQYFPHDNIKRLLIELRHNKSELLQHASRYAVAIEAILETQ